MNTKKRGLGKGLDALLGNSSNALKRQMQDDMQAELSQAKTERDSELQYLPIEWLSPGKYQPRKDMSQSTLEELANSIRTQGVIQPIIVRSVAEQKYEIIAGERRWRASQLAHLDKIPCMIKQVADDAAVAIALIENIQREDLNAIEEASALKRLLEEFGMTHQQLADAVGKSRTAVSNLLRLNQLNTDVQLLVEHGDLEMGHARALLALEGETQSEIARLVVQKDLTVRETERLVKKVNNPPEPKAIKEPDPDIIRLAQQLSDQLGTDVNIKPRNKQQGRLEISYHSLQEFDKIIRFLHRNEK